MEFFLKAVTSIGTHGPAQAAPDDKWMASDALNRTV
jgi:hypothetical protein